MKIYSENNKIEMNDLYEKMLDWSSKQKHTTKKYNQ